MLIIDDNGICIHIVCIQYMYTVTFCHPVQFALEGGGGRNSRSKFNLKVTYDSSSNKGRNKCNTSFLCNFDRKIHFFKLFL